MQTINIKNLLRLGKQQELRPLHFVLANRNKHKFGEIDNVFNVQYHPQLQTSELSFTIYKTVDGKDCRLWDKITPRRLLWVKEYQEWFEISVDIDDSEKIIKKNITATALCKAELSQINLDNTEINTETDIARSDYAVSTFCNFDNPNASILHRLLKKVPNYKIKHVDETLYNIQRSFSIGDDTNIYDFLTGTLSEEIGCLFLFNSNERGIYVYDMETGCLDCGYRDENDFDICPKCGKSNIHKPYGQDTAIFVSKDNLGENIQLTSNAEEVKNCFKVTGGDDKINAAIINNNPNGTNTIYVFDEDTRNDMPEDLVSKIDEYDDLIEEYRTTHTFTISENAVTQYNNLISKINSIYTDKFSFIADSYSGYSNVITKYYDTFDLGLYLESSMMPAWEQSDKTAQSQIELVEDELKSVSVRDVSIISKSTADNAVLLMVKAIIDTGIYKAEIKNSSLSSQLWTGQIILTNYSDEEDSASSDILTIEINDNYTSFVRQCLQKAAAKTDTVGIKELFNIQNINDFKSELKKYCLSSLKGFQNAYQSALQVLVNENISDEDSEFYNDFYVPYYEKSGAVEYEIYIRESDLSTVSLIQTELQNIINDTQKNLDFENYLGGELWQVFLSYRREDNYSNENYISDGLTNEELIQKANELTQTAYKELIKSSTKQYTITGTLHNLLLIRDDEGNQVFAPILEDFTLGNFIRCKIDGIIYKMRILDVTIDYDNLNSLSVTFGDVSKGLKTLSGNISDIIKQSNSIAKSYSAVKKQAKQGEDAGITLNQIKEDGLNSAQYNVFNTFSTFVLDDHGLLGRNYYDVTDQYTPEQLRITGNNIVMTDNNWLSTKLAIGKQSYTLNGDEHTAYGVIADTLVGSQIIGSDIYSDNYTTDSEGNVIQGFNFSKSGNFNLADGRFSYNQETNILKLRGVTMDWNSSNAPVISDINGLEDTLNDLTDSENTASEEISDLKTTVSAHEAQISTVQGQIESKVWQQDITTSVAEIKIGGRNLLLNTGQTKTYIGTNSTNQVGEFYEINSTSHNGKEVTFSFDWNVDGETLGGYFYIRYSTSPYTSFSVYIYPSDTNKSGHYERTFTLPNDGVSNLIVRMNNFVGTLTISNAQLELGNKATDWTPAPEDVKNDITELSTKYTDVKQTTDGLSATVASHTTQISNKAENSTVTAIDSKVTSLTADLSGFKTTVSSAYTTKTEFNNLEIGSRNLIRYDNVVQYNSGTLDKSNLISAGEIIRDEAVRYGGFRFDSINCYEPSTNYVLSGYITVLSGTVTNFMILNGGKVGHFFYFEVDGVKYGNPFVSGFTEINSLLNDKKEHYFVLKYQTAVTIPDDTGTQYTYFQINSNDETAVKYKISRFNLQKGNKATDWTPAPEDIQQQVTAVNTIATQTANKFNWLVSSGTSATDFTLTDRMAELTAEAISLNGNVKVNGNMLVDGAITGDKLNMAEIFSRNITATNMNIEGGTIGSWHIEKSIERARIYAMTNDGKYTVHIQTPSLTDGPDTWVFSSLENIDNKTYGRWYVTADGYMYCPDGYFSTRNRNIDGKGIEIHDSTIDFYSWSDKDNLAGSIWTSYVSGSTTQKLLISCDNGDILALGYTKNGGVYTAIQINDPEEDNGQVDINTYMKCHSDVSMDYNATINGNATVGYLNVKPQNSLHEGGQITLKGAGTHTDINIDSYYGDLRFFDKTNQPITFNCTDKTITGGYSFDGGLSGTLTTSGLSMYSSRVTVTSGGYYQSAGMVFVQMVLTINTTLSANDYWNIISGFPTPRTNYTAFSISYLDDHIGVFNANLNGSNLLIRTSSIPLTSGDKIAISGIYLT